MKKNLLTFGGSSIPLYVICSSRSRNHLPASLSQRSTAVSRMRKLASPGTQPTEVGRNSRDAGIKPMASVVARRCSNH
ncbi:hypothetical protein BC830DRAFT_1112238 [Chytriomyces sp. MP71]|nr:hypothetical protein BC830DRAFT_1112237 [Chytriomyces sp. MP71]KAI8617711.1 hypothetical protein BC830DRAFT_1112238 [Chytriomyces sp. MP71]